MPGTASTRSARRFAFTSTDAKLPRPVAFPPGRRCWRRARAPRVADLREHDRDGAGGLLGRQRGDRRSRDDDVDAALHQLRRQRAGALLVAVREPGLKGDRLSFDVAEVAQPLPEGVEAAEARFGL